MNTKHHTSTLIFLALCAAQVTAQPRIEPPPADVAAVGSWADAAFGPPRPVPIIAATPDGLTVLRQSHKVLINHTAWDTPITLGDRQFAHGIYMDAPAALLVRLPQPASELMAQVGIDNNRDTRAAPTTSSARFHVTVADKRVLSTPVRKLGDGSLAVRVPLSGAGEFILEIDDGGDGRSHDQCVWADASVKFADGSMRFLDTLPFVSKHINRSNVPLSFLYGGQPSDTLLPGWQRVQKSEAVPGGTRQTTSYRDPKTGLLVEIELIRYHDAAALDLVCWLSNTGTADSPLIEDLMPLDSQLLPPASAHGPVTLRWSNGDGCTESSFLPHDEPLVPGSPRELAATSSDTTSLPFFNLHAADGGWIIAVGWTGRWKAGFLQEPSSEVRVSAGMQATRFRLKPGERIRTPRIVLLRYGGQRLIDGHNAFRRLMLAHYVPQQAGKPAMPPVATTNVAALWLRSARTKKPLGLLNEAGELALIPRAAEMGCEAYWMDAYWFPQPWYQGNIGNWFPRPDDFPGGLRPLADAAHRHELEFVLWFAPLHINPGTQWARQYPQFVHGGGDGRGGVWKLGDAAAREALVAWLSDRRRQWAFDVYREDFGTGMPPEEGDERIGVAEMKHIDGFYQFWTELKRRNPGLLIDNCSGGGRRIDIETARLAYCLWRSDFNDVGEGLKDRPHWPRMGRADQVMVTGLSLYYPLHAGPVWEMSPYSFRSAMGPGIVIYTDTDSPEFSAESARLATAELKRLRPLFLGDIYPSLPLTTNQADWYAYQLDRPDLGQGCVFVFRRPDSPDAVREIHLENIDPQARYSVNITGDVFQQAQPIVMSGRELAQRKVQIDARPGSTLIEYRKDEGGTTPVSTGEALRPCSLNFVPTVKWLPAPRPVPGAAAERESEMRSYTEEVAGLTFDMVPIRGGRFRMGSPANEKARRSDEGPVHEVAVEPFWMGKCEVTWPEFEFWIHDLAPLRRRQERRRPSPWERIADAIALPTTRPYTDPSYDMGKRGYPAVCMTHLAARLYCKWLSASTGRYYRLPTEAEWEYACRAGSATAYSFGDDSTRLGDYAWYEDNSLDKYQKVGTKKPNAWGLYDMHGNVAEWVIDAYNAGFYAKPAASGKAPLAVPSGRYPHVYRGGSWLDDPMELRSAARRGSNRELSSQDPQIPQGIAWHTDAQHVGFRVLRPLRLPAEDECRRWEATDEVEKEWRKAAGDPSCK